jgi:methionyl-tRNA formyltransferase
VRVRTFSDPVLRRKATPVKRITASVRRLAEAMVETMRAHRGVGLAAPQVGESVRLAVVDVGDGLHVLVNPRVTASSGRAVDWEGCLSFPGLLAEIERAEKVSVEALDLESRPVWLEAEGFLARALQHEIDHLDGVVILDRARAVEKIEPEEEEGVWPRAERPLRVAFMGTPSFALPTLEALSSAGHEIVGVVTRPDRPAGRGGRTLRPSPVKEAALRLGLEVWQGSPAEVRTTLPGVLAGWRADVAVVVAYGVILPRAVLSAPRLGCLNLHASLLPDYRGAAPIQRALLDGCHVTGVTVIRMDEGMDTGDIVVQREVEVGPEETAGQLHDRLARTGAGLVLEALDLLATGKAVFRKQPAGPARPAPKLGPEDEVIDWSRPAEAVACQVRALDPVPGAHTVFRGQRVKVWRVEPGPAAGLSAPGRVVAFESGAPVVATGRGTIVLRALQPAGGSRMTGAEFVNGFRVEIGDSFGEPGRR